MRLQTLVFLKLEISRQQRVIPVTPGLKLIGGKLQ